MLKTLNCGSKRRILAAAGVVASVAGPACITGDGEGAPEAIDAVDSADALATDDEATADARRPDAQGVLTLATGEKYRWTRTVLQGGELDEHYFDADGRELAAADIEQRIAAADRARWDARGAMSDDLFGEYTQMPADARTRVWGWLRLTHAPGDRGVPGADREVDAEARAAHARVLARMARLSADASPAARAVHVDGPFVQLELSRAELTDLAWSGEFVQLDQEYVDRGPASSGVWYQTIGDDLNVAAGWDGTGRKVGIIEPGAPTSPSQLGTIAAQATPASAPGYYTDTHMQICAGVVSDNVVGESQHGTAPAVGLLLANWAGFTGPEVDLRLWAANQGADAISISRAGIPWDAAPNVNDMYNDWLSLRYPYPLIALAAGNDGADPDPALQYVHQRGYNTVTVGASNDNGTAARSLDSLAYFSSWKNSTTPFGDRELPELVAPGYNYCAGGLCGSGTSLATPMVAATAAQMRERNPALASYPEAIKAMLMATSDCNVSQVVLNFTDAIDDKDGTGNLNGRKAVNLAASTYEPATFSTSGHSYGNISFTTAAQWNSTKYIGKTFRARTDANGQMHVVLTWNSTPVCTNETSSASCSGWGPDGDLNLYLTNALTGTITRTSVSRDNNYEFIQVSAQPNTNYYIEIYKTGTPRNNSTWYGLAWVPTAAACPNPT